MKTKVVLQNFKKSDKYVAVMKTYSVIGKDCLAMGPWPQLRTHQ